MTNQKTSFNQADKKWLKKNFITRSSKDVNSIKNMITVAVDDAIEKKQLVTKDDIGHLPTKDEFFKRTDEIMKELKTIRENTDVVSGQMKDRTDRIEKLEKAHPNIQHAN